MIDIYLEFIMVVPCDPKTAANNVEARLKFKGGDKESGSRFFGSTFCAETHTVSRLNFKVSRETIPSP